jgi:hypothetical protein
LNPNKSIRIIALLLALLVLALLPGLTERSAAQGGGSWWGSNQWFDWSDFRANAGVRIFLPRLVSGSLEGRGRSDSFGAFGFADDPELFRQAWFELYIDRLGLRANIEEDQKFRGRLPLNGEETMRISELDASTSRLGLDLDLVRYPYLALGINFDYYVEQLTFHDRRDSDPNHWYVYKSSQPLTIGLHGRALPGRIREIPLVFEGSVRVPVPFVNRPTETKIIDWEVSGGLRPAIWDMSLYGHSTFSFGIEVGFRSIYLEMIPREAAHPLGGDTDVKLRAHWQGFFTQIGFYF